METEEFKGHALWVEIDNLRVSLATTVFPDGKQLISERLKALCAYLAGRKAVPASLIYPTLMNSVYTALMAVQQSLAQFVASANPAYLDQVNAQVDGVLVALAPWPQVQGVQRQTAAVAATFEALFAQMKLDAEAHRLAAQQFTQQLVILQQQRSQLEQELVQIQSQGDVTAKRILDAATEQNAAFSKAQLEKSEVFAQWLLGRRAEIAEADSRREEALKGYAKSAAMVLGEMEETQQKTEKVAGGTTSAILARDFAGYAQREFWLALGSYGIGLVGFVIAGTVLFFSLGSLSVDQSATWQWVSLKIGLTVTMVGGASVFISLGNKFLRGAGTNKRVELELRAIGPFLADLHDDESARAAKVAFVDRTFGRSGADVSGGRAEDEVSVGALDKLADVVVRIASLGGKAT